MQPLKTTAAALAGLAVLAMIVVQFVPWASFQQSSSSGGGNFGGFSFPGFSFDVKVTSNTWNAKTTVNGETDTTSWYDGDLSDTDGVGLLRAAIPVLLAGALALLVGTLLAAARGGTAGSVVCLAAGVLLAVGTTLFIVGTHQFYDDADFTWGGSFYVAIVACLLAIAGGVLGLVDGNRASNATF
jgi:hypothetical protein